MGWYNSSWLRRISVTVSIDKTKAYVDLSNLGASFFAGVQNGGADIRVTKSDGENEVAVDVRSCNTSNSSGWIVFATGESKSATTALYYIYFNNSAASAYAAGDTYGRNAVYDSEHVLVLSLDEDPSGSAPQFTDRTGNGNSGTSGGSMTAGDSVAGTVDNQVDLDGVDDRITASPTFPSGSFTVMCLTRVDSNPSAFKSMSGIDHSNTGNFALFYLQINSSNEWVFSVFNTSGTGFSSNAGAISTGSSVFTAGHYNDSTKAVTVNIDGADASSATLTGTRANATGDLAVGAAYFSNALADFFPGFIDEYVLFNVDLDEDELGAYYEELKNNSSAVTVGAVEAETEIPAYTFTHYGRKRTWTGNIFKSGFVGSTKTICTGREMKVTWGRATNTFDSRVRAAEAYIDIVDPSFEVYNDLSSTSSEERDFRVELTDSTGTYTLRMLIRLDELETMLVDDLETQITRIYCYCGMAEMRNIDAITATSATFGSLFSQMLVSNAISQNIEFISQHYPKNIASTGILYDLMRLNRLDLIYIESGRKSHNMYDQLKGVLEGFGLIAFNGMDGQWHVKHDYALGETLTGARGAFQYNVLSGALISLATLTGTSFDLRNARVNFSAMRRPVQAVQAVEAIRGNTDSSKFITVDLVRFGDFEEGWIDSTNHHSWQTDGVRTTDSDTGTYALEIDSGEFLYQDLPRFGGAQNIDFEIALRVAMRESAAAAGASRQIQIQLQLWNLILNGSSAFGYGDVDGWSETATGILYTTMSVGNASNLIYATFITTFRGPMLEQDGFIRLRVDTIPALNYSAYLDSVEVRMKSGGSSESSYRAIGARYDLDNELIGRGEVVEQRVHFFNGLLGLDPEGDGVRNSLVEMMQVLTTSAGSWVQMAEFNSEVTGFTTNDYPGLFDLSSDIRINQQDATIEEIEVQIPEIVPPDQIITYDEKNYIQVFTDIDLTLEITESIAIRKLVQSTATQEAGAIYWGDSDLNVKSATISDSVTPFPVVFTHFTLGATYSQIVHGRVDAATEQCFLLVQLAAGGRSLIRVDNFKSSPTITTILTDSSSQIFNIDAGRTGQNIYLIKDNVSGVGTYQIQKYNYAGTLQQIIASESSGDKAQWLCVDEAEEFLYYRHLKSIGSEDECRRIDLSDLSETNLGTSSLDSSGEINTGKTDATQGKLFVLGALGSLRKITQRDKGSAGAETDWIGSLGGVTDEGFAIDHGRQKGIYAKVGGDIYWDDLASSGSEEKIYEGGASAPTIAFVCTGIN